MQKRIFSKETESFIVDLYQNKLKSIKSISQIIQLKEWTIKRILLENDIKIRSKFAFSQKYDIDNSFFEKIDTEEKAYFLGFLYADGAVYESKKGSCFRLFLKESDKEILYEFLKALKAKIGIYITRNKNQCGVAINNKKMVKDLIKLKCTPRKSLTLEFPSEEIVPQHLMMHFIRGFFDGDGSIFFQEKNNRIELRIISSLPFCKGYKEFLSKTLNIDHFYNGKIVYSKHEKIGYQSIGIGKYESILKIYNFLYENATIFLKRKHQIFITYFEYKKKIKDRISKS